MAYLTAEPGEPFGFEETPFSTNRGVEEVMSIKHMLTKNETLLWDLRIQRDTKASRQIELLQAIRRELACQSTPLQFFCNAILQMVFVAAALLFGIFAVYQYIYQVQGNFQSLIANQANMVIFCMANNLSTMTVPCDEILQKAPATMAYLASETFSDPSLGASWPWSVQLTQMLQQPIGIVTMIVAPFSTGFIGFLATWLLYRERFGQTKASEKIRASWS